MTYAIVGRWLTGPGSALRAGTEAECRTTTESDQVATMIQKGSLIWQQTGAEDLAFGATLGGSPNGMMVVSRRLKPELSPGVEVQRTTTVGNRSNNQAQRHFL